RDPVAFKDTQLGLVRLRAFGNFTMRVTQPLLFVNSLVGTQGSYTTDQIEDYLRDVIVARLNDFLGENVQTLWTCPRATTRWRSRSRPAWWTSSVSTAPSWSTSTSTGSRRRRTWSG